MLGRIDKRRRKDEERRQEQNRRDELTRGTQPAQPPSQEDIQAGAARYREQREVGAQRGRQRAQEMFSDVPMQRRAREQSGQAAIQRQAALERRRLGSTQGARGVAGGTSFAQAQSLEQAVRDAQAQLGRDLSDADIDMMLRRKAAEYAIEQGEAGQADLDYQRAYEDLTGRRERERQKAYEDYLRDVYTRI